jgi:hypothetical protein
MHGSGERGVGGQGQRRRVVTGRARPCFRVELLALAPVVLLLQCSKLDERDLSEGASGTAGSGDAGSGGAMAGGSAGISGRGGSGASGGGATAGTSNGSGAAGQTGTGGGAGSASAGAAGVGDAGAAGDDGTGGEGAEPGTGGGSGAAGSDTGDAGSGGAGEAECTQGAEESCSTECGAGTRACNTGAWGPCTTSCGEALSAQGTCASGRATCSGSAWGSCSIMPASRDSCAPGNDDTCDGQPYTGCTCGSFTMPNPASSTLPNPAAYTTSSETVADDRTGLIWERGSSPDQLTLGEASAYCSQLAVGGVTDWRLPSILELATLIDFTRTAGPKIDTAAFPDTVAFNYWSSTPVEGEPGDLWQVGFDSGYVSTFPSNFTIFVRCVRGSGSRCYPNGARFQMQPGNAVYDAATGLTWQQAVSAEVTFANAAAQCPSSFRLPSYKELSTLVDFSRAAPGPVIDTVSFPSTPAEGFWTSTLTPTSSIYAFIVDFATGASSDRDTSSGQVRLRVRCVQ